MVPAVFVPLTALPVSANGKIDRKALPAPEAGRGELANEYLAPVTPTQVQLAALWSDVLRVERVGLRDNFFELGGHSLLATQVLSRVRAEFEVVSRSVGSGRSGIPRGDCGSPERNAQSRALGTVLPGNRRTARHSSHDVSLR
jgi:hypothetical protein